MSRERRVVDITLPEFLIVCAAAFSAIWVVVNAMTNPIPIVQFDYLSHLDNGELRCVEVINPDSDFYTCDNLPPKFKIEWVDTTLIKY